MSSIEASEPFNPVFSSTATKHVQVQDKAPETDTADDSVAAPTPEPVLKEKSPEFAPQEDKPDRSKSPDPADRFARQFEKLSKKELELRQKEQELKALAAEVEGSRKLRDLAKTDKLSALRELNVSVDDILRDHLNGGRPDPGEQIAALQAKIDKLESMMPKMREEYSEHNQAVLMDMGERWDHDFNNLLERDEYQIVKHSPGEIERIQKGVFDYYQSSKKLLPAKQVLDIVSKELRDKHESISKYLSPKAPPAPTEPAAKTSGPKTISPKLNAIPRYSYLADEQDEFAALIARRLQK